MFTKGYLVVALPLRFELASLLTARSDLRRHAGGSAVQMARLSARGEVVGWQGIEPCSDLWGSSLTMQPVPALHSERRARDPAREMLASMGG